MLRRFLYRLIPDITVGEQFEALGELRQDLSQISLYPSVAGQVPDLLTLSEQDDYTPELQSFDLQPEIVPALSGQVADLQAQTYDFFSDLLFPTGLRDAPFVWQHLYQVQDVNPIDGVIVG